MGGHSVDVYYASGKFTVTALYGDANVTFHLTAVDRRRPRRAQVPGARMKLISGDKRSSRAGTTFPAARPSSTHWWFG